MKERGQHMGKHVADTPQICSDALMDLEDDWAEQRGKNLFVDASWFCFDVGGVEWDSSVEEEDMVSQVLSDASLYSGYSSSFHFCHYLCSTVCIHNLLDYTLVQQPKIL